MFSPDGVHGRQFGIWPFAQKLDTYRKPDGQVDPTLIDRDIKNNNADENLIEYKRITDAVKQEIEDIIGRAKQARWG